MRRLLLLLLPLLAVAGALHLPAPAASAAPVQPQPIHAATDVTYDVRLDQGAVRVFWDVTLTNNDPQTVYREFGTVYYYFSYAVPVLRGATGLSATGPTGAPLAVSLRDAGERTLLFAEVTFDRNFYYGETYSFTLSYTLADARDELLLVTPYYVYLPALAFGDPSTVRVVTPDGDPWHTNVESADCPSAGDAVFQCSTGGFIEAAALVEVSDPTSLETLPHTLSLNGREIDVTVRHFPGERAWADRMLQLAEASMTVLQEIFGYDYPGPDAFTISERGQADLLGYDGIFDCYRGLGCDIGISPITHDMTAIHEFAHFWTEPFDERWLAEGFAEFAARRTAALLGDLVAPRPPAPLEEIDIFPLDSWSSLRSLIQVDEEAALRELSGYERSLQAIEALERRVGLEAIQEANRRLHASGEYVDSRNYLDFIEDAAGEPLHDFFLEWVFAPNMAGTLEQRREVRDRLDRVREELRREDIVLPGKIEAWVYDTWAFDSAEEELDRLEDAFAVYVEAKEAVEGGKTWWERFGLHNRDAAPHVEAAARLLEEGRYRRSIARAERALDVVGSADRVALYRFAVAAGMFGLVTVSAGTAFVAGWRNTYRR